MSEYIFRCSFSRRFIAIPLFVAAAIMLYPALSASAKEREQPLFRESSVNHRSSTRRTLSQLSLYTDLWHLAVTRGNDEKALRYQQTLVTIFRSDIDVTARLVRRFARRIALAGADSGLAGVDRKTLADKFHRSLELLRSKAKLMRQIDRREMSADTSQLAGKYMDLLRRQMGLEKIWLASASAGLREDRADSRR